MFIGPIINPSPALQRSAMFLHWVRDDEFVISLLWS